MAQLMQAVPPGNRNPACETPCHFRILTAEGYKENSEVAQLTQAMPPEMATPLAGRLATSEFWLPKDARNSEVAQLMQAMPPEMATPLAGRLATSEF